MAFKSAITKCILLLNAKIPYFFTQNVYQCFNRERFHLPTDPHSGCAKLLNHPSYLCFSIRLNNLSENRKKKDVKYQFIVRLHKLPKQVFVLNKQDPIQHCANVRSLVAFSHVVNNFWLVRSLLILLILENVYNFTII